MYSSIPKNQRKSVIDKCYWPLLELSDKYPLGIESSALTLEIINDIDPLWIKSLKNKLTKNEVEFIGSGYSQIIGPLVPAKVNDYNQRIGMMSYEQILDAKPKIALINEMAFSGGIIEHYLNNGYEAIIMEWNNPKHANADWKKEWRFFSQKAVGPNREKIPVIWSDSVAFQKFQRFVHGHNSLDQYLDYLKNNLDRSINFFPLYSNDAEIFDYRPGRYSTEPKIGNNSEWKKINNLYESLSKKDWAKFILPYEMIKHKSDFKNNLVKLETVSQPIPVKKQIKYNINRWALSGRDDCKINSLCYDLYENLLRDKDKDIKNWKEVCYLWSSDFRTHITKERWNEYIKRLKKFQKRFFQQKKFNAQNLNDIKKFVKKEDSGSYMYIESDEIVLSLNKKKGLSINALTFKSMSEKPVLSSIEHGFYDDITLAADFYSGHCVIERPGNHKIADLEYVEPKITLTDGFSQIQSKNDINKISFNTYYKYHKDGIIIGKKIESKLDEKLIVRPFNFTLNPLAWDRDSLFVEVHNGGFSKEKFLLKGTDIAHSKIYSSLISSCNVFGFTERQIFIGDKNIKIQFSLQNSNGALLPSIIYKEIDDMFFLRLHFSAQEIDETLKKNKLNLHSEILISKPITLK